MATTAFWILTLAVIAGTGLAFWHLRSADSGSRPPFAAGIAHGVVGTIGLVALLLALRGPSRGVDDGVGSFATMAAALFAGAALTGAAMLWFRRNGAVMAIHAGIAVAGYVLLLAWNSLG